MNKQTVAQIKETNGYSTTPKACKNCRNGYGPTYLFQWPNSESTQRFELETGLSFGCKVIGEKKGIRCNVGDFATKPMATCLFWERKKS